MWVSGSRVPSSIDDSLSRELRAVGEFNSVRSIFLDFHSGLEADLALCNNSARAHICLNRSTREKKKKDSELNTTKKKQSRHKQRPA